MDAISANNTGGNFNRFWYANNNPYTFIDPDGRQPNQAGTTSPAYLYFYMTRNSLSQMEKDHRTNENRYFYTESYGWVDVRHFARAADLVIRGVPGGTVRIAGIANEFVQYATEWGGDYRSGFSSEDLPSNNAGIDFGNGYDHDLSLAANFLQWAKKNGAQGDNSYVAGRDLLPATDPAAPGVGAGTSSSKSEEKRNMKFEGVKVYRDCGKICSMTLTRESRS